MRTKERLNWFGKNSALAMSMNKIFQKFLRKQ